MGKIFSGILRFDTPERRGIERERERVWEKDRERERERERGRERKKEDLERRHWNKSNEREKIKIKTYLHTVDNSKKSLWVRERVCQRKKEREWQREDRNRKIRAV